MKKERLTNTHVTLNVKEAEKALKTALPLNPEINLSALIRALLRKYISDGGKL